MAAPQFLYAEYLRLLERVILNKSGFYHCKPETLCVLRQILYTEYPYQEDDIEYLMDMTNYYIRKSGYIGRKSRFPISKYLDAISKDEFYISSFATPEQFPMPLQKKDTEVSYLRYPFTNSTNFFILFSNLYQPLFKHSPEFLYTVCRNLYSQLLNTLCFRIKYVCDSIPVHILF